MLIRIFPIPFTVPFDSIRFDLICYQSELQSTFADILIKFTAVAARDRYADAELAFFLSQFV